MVNQLTLLKLGALILVITLTSCGRIPHFLADKNDFTLRKVECTKENGVSIVQEFTENTQSYSDSLFKIKFMIHPTGMQFKIQNNHNGQIKINWNESTLKSNLTQLDGKVIHYGIKFIQSSDFLPPSVIPKNDTLSDKAIPSEFVKWIESSSKYQTSYWTSKDFVNITGNNKSTLIKNLEQINKHNIRLGLQIEVDKKISDYLFTFNFNNQSNIINNPSNIDNYYSLYIKEDQNSIKLNKDIVKAKKQSEKGSNSILNILAIGGIAGLLIFSLIAL